MATPEGNSTSSTKPRWPTVTRDHPCPVCGRPVRCKVSPDGRRALCWYVESLRPAKGGQAWLHRVEVAPPPSADDPGQTPPNFSVLAAECAARLTPPGRERLARALKLPVESLELLAVGVDQTGRAFTFPETDAAGAVVGVNRRFIADGSKKAVRGGKRGLTLPAGWRGRGGSDPLFIVEGPTDTVAMSHAGLGCVGRPSCTGGAGELARLLADWPVERPIIVVGENDAKPDGRHPGRDGAVRLAEALAEALQRLVGWTLPPADAKDARAWLTADERGDQPWTGRGDALARGLAAGAVLVSPLGGQADGVAGPDGVRRGSDVRAEIVVTLDVGQVNDQAAEVLGRVEDVYQRSGRLVHVVEQEADCPESAVVRRWAGATRVRDLPPPLLLDRLTRVATWVREKASKQESVFVPTTPPAWCVAGVHAAGQWPGVRKLSGVITYPVVLADGTILANPGYHPETGLLIRPRPGLVVSVPDAPTETEVKAALALILAVVSEFPFEREAHRAAWVAALLTPLAWHAFNGPAPFFLVDANVRGVGKTLLVDVIGHIVTGGPLPVMVYTADEDELRKRITTLAAEGTGPVTLDNLSGPVGNGTFDAALTSSVWRDRILGGNTSFEGPLSVVWYGTGNNCQLQADTGRRTCGIRLETPLERPETKADFRHPELRRHVRENRNQLLSAALTVLRAWMLAGQPKQNLTPWGSFEGWSDMVRGAVVWAGLDDPGDTRQELLLSADRDALAVQALTIALARIDPHRRGLYAAEMIGRSAADPDLYAALDALTHGRVEANVLGRRLAAFRRRVVGGLFLDQTSQTNRGWRWAAFPECQFSHARRGAAGGDGGESGDPTAGPPD